MLKYRSLKVLSDIWLKGLHALMSFTDFLHAAAEKAMDVMSKAENSAVAKGIALDEAATEAAHDAHDKLVAEHSRRLEAIANLVSDAESEGKRIIAAAEAQAKLLAARARTVENDTIDAYAVGVKKARDFLTKAIEYHA